MRLLAVIDMQEDFVRGVLRVPGAEEIIPGIKSKIDEYLTEDDLVLFTRDTHYDATYSTKYLYKNTREGIYLPIHCIESSEGWNICKEFKPFQNSCYILDKINSFGFSPEALEDASFAGGPNLDCITNNIIDEITIVGVVTNICVLSCAVSFQTIFPNADIIVDASLCRSNDNELHDKALDVMKGLQMHIINRD